MDAFFRPSSVVVIGATDTPGTPGRTLLQNLLSNPFGGVVSAVTPHPSKVLGVTTYPSLADVPGVPDLAVVVTPARDVPGVVAECGARGVGAAIIVSAGFRETGEEGAALERRVVDAARRCQMRLVGPDSLGVMSPLTGLNATVANGMARRGNVAFLSQSAALCTAVLDWSLKEDVGFSAFVSVGSMIDVGWGDLIDHLGHDPRTRSIVIYMESIGNARAFLSAAREVALTKPIIVIKAGRTREAARAAASHTGAMTGSDEVLDAAFLRCGVLRVDDVAELFYMAEALSKQPRPRGPRLTILTNAGGPGVLATDALIANGGQLADLSVETGAALDALLPAHWNRSNPIDLQGDADPDRYARAVEVTSRDPGSDGLLVVMTPQAQADPTGTAESLGPFAALGDRPIIASWMGGASVAAGEATLNRAGIPTFAYPDTAARVFSYMWRYSRNLKALYETPALPAGLAVHLVDDRQKAKAIIRGVRHAGRTLLTEVESKALLSAYEIPVVETVVAASEDEAVAAAARLGYPVVVKLHSETVGHKSGVGGVKLDLRSAGDVAEAYRAIRNSVAAWSVTPLHPAVTVQPMVRLDGYEMILGSALDPQFGPVLLVGSGGVLAEAAGDRAIGLPPLNTTLARRLLEQTRIFRAIQGVRGRPPADVAALEQVVVRFSHLVSEQRWVKEVDINPLIVSQHGVVALDARVAVHEPDVGDHDIPPLAIRPYPSKYIGEFTLKNGSRVTIRPIRPEDEPMMVQFHETLSDRSVYFRYFHPVKLGHRVSHERLTRICFIDYDREMALVAEERLPDGEARILGVGRLTRQRDAPNGEFAILVTDAMQGQGLGTELLRRVVAVGREEGLERITADILPDNRDMQAVAEKVGFRCALDAREGLVKAELPLAAGGG